jgi:uncharacterized protein (TIGR02118 family)
MQPNCRLSDHKQTEKEKPVYKFVTIYRRVDDQIALENFFSQTHMSLAEKLPGLVKSEVSRITGQPGGQSRFHLMYELYFSSKEEYLKAMATETGLALSQALTPWWEAKIIDWYYAESFEEEATVREQRQEIASAEEQDPAADDDDDASAEPADEEPS